LVCDWKGQENIVPILPKAAMAAMLARSASASPMGRTPVSEEHAAGGFHSLTRDPEIVVRQQGSDHAADIVGQADAPKGSCGRPGRNGPYEPRRLSTFISKKRRQ
jgi:hypothetical protein